MHDLPSERCQRGRYVNKDGFRYLPCNRAILLL